MKKILSCGLSVLLLMFAACSDMPTSNSDDEADMFSPFRSGQDQGLSKIGFGAYTTGSTVGLDASSVTIAKPTSSIGDFLIAQITVADINSTDVICAPSNDWTSILRTNSPDDKIHQEIFWRTSGADAGPYTWTFRQGVADCGTGNHQVAKKSVGGIISYSNVDIAHAGGPIFGSAGRSTDKDSTTFHAPSIDNAPAGSRVIRFFGIDHKENLVTTSGGGSTQVYGVLNVKDATHNEKPSIAAADAEQATLGATGTVAGSVPDHGGKWSAQTVVVYAANTAPTLSDVPEDTTVCEGVELTFDADATDDDVPAQTLTFSLEGSVPDGASINSSTGVFTWTPGETQDGGPYSITVRVTDDGTPAMYDEMTIDVTVSEANLPPVLDPIGNQAVIANQLLSFTATASDPDTVNGSLNTLTFSLEGTVPAGAVIDGTTGEFTWTPTDGDVGPHNVTVRVTDDGPDGDCGTGDQYDEETFTITVEEEPEEGTFIIDIKPGVGLNTINCNNANGLIPVALLSTETFDATTVDHATVMFEGASEAHVNKKTGEPQRHEEDVNGDDLIDLVFHFKFSDTSLTCDSVEGTLTGMTFDDNPIEGVDGLNMIVGGPH